MASTFIFNKKKPVTKMLQAFIYTELGDGNRPRDWLITNVICFISNQLNQCVAMAASTKNSLKKPRIRY